MSAAIIDGKAAAAELRATVAADVAELAAATGTTPRLDVVLVGDHPSSAAYVGGKTRAAAAAGITGRVHRLAAEVTQAALVALVRDLGREAGVHGILVQLPLPPHLDPIPVLEAIDPLKDVDGLHPLNQGLLLAGRPEAMLPCTPRGCVLLLERTLGAGGLRGRRALVLGRSSLVGKPLALLLLQADCTVSVAHSRSGDLRALCREADILVAAVGRPGMVRGDWIRDGATVIDVGINRVEDADGKARLVGDVHFEEAAQRAAAITPVPGGVGPMTVACLLANTLEAARRQAARHAPS